jgi:hypothetical protein
LDPIDLGILGLAFDDDGFGLRPGVLGQLLFVVGLVLLQRHQLLFQLRVLAKARTPNRLNATTISLLIFI